tara:strand:- start:456 stop:917 length:462 start_codon:yes stop_codon:yes gene_type:complete
MKLEFKDNLKREAIDLYFNIPNVEADITVKEAEVTWNLNIEYKSWGIDTFQYQLNKLQLTALVETYIEEKDQTEDTELIFHISYNSKTSSHECKIFEELVKDGEWIEEVYVTLPLKLKVEEKPATDTDNRSQIYVKYIELDLNNEEKSLTLTI